MNYRTKKHFFIVLAVFFITFAFLLLQPATQTRADVVNIAPNAKHANDNTGEAISEITSNDSTVNPDTLSAVVVGDGAYTVDKGKIMQFTTFDVSSIPGGSIITSVALHFQFGAEDGYNGTNPVRYDNGAGLTSAGITPTDITGFSADQSFDLFAVGVDTLNEIQNIDIEFTNNDGAQPDAIHFDYLWLTVSYTTAQPTTTLGNGANPSNASLAPGDIITDLDSFTFQSSAGSDSVTALTVTLSAGSSGGLNDVRITSDNGVTTYFSAVANPSSDTVSFSGGTPIPVTISSTQFKARVTPKSHANMPAPPGSIYTVTGTVTSFTSANIQAGSDTDSATITIDNQSPGNVTGASGSAGNSQVSLSWTNPGDSDFHSAIVLRRAGTAVSDAPTEGTAYVVGNTIGASTVACVVVSPIVSCADTGLTNGTAYHYRIYTRDNNVNYSTTGVAPTGSPFTPAVATDTNEVSPTSAIVSSTGNTFTFTYTAAETMNSGEISINAPSGWSAPQGTAGTAGYATASSVSGMVANVEDNGDSVTGWSAGTACANGLTADTTTKQEGTAAIKCANGNESNGDVWYKNITTENWSDYTKMAFWIYSSANVTANRLHFAYDDNANLASPLETISVGALSANTWTYVVLNFGVTTRTSVASFGFLVNHPAAVDNADIWADDFLLGPGSATFPGGGDIRARLLQLADTQTVTVTYGSGGGASGATAPSIADTYTFTTKSRASDAGTLTSIASSPTVTVNNPAPTTTGISPSSKTAGDSGFTMTVNGTNFVSSSVVKFSGSNRATTFINSTQLTAAILSSDLTTAGNFNITVFNPPPGGGTSNAQTFTVNNPAPTTTDVSPSSKTAGDSGFTMTVNGANFVSSSVVRFDGSSRATTFVSSTQLTATIPSSDLTGAGTFSITVFSPTPGGGTSNAQTFTVNNPAPTTTGVSPDNKIVGDSGFTITVNGANFVSSSVVKFDDSNRATTFINSTQLTATIPATDLTTAGNFNVTVFNPAPGGGTSNAQTFTVNNPAVSTTSISPSSKTAGDSGFTMTVNGVNFVSSSVVKFNDSNRATTFINSTQLTAAILSSDLTTAGNFNITVFNPPPGGGTSNAQTFTVNNPAPTTTGVSPSSKTVGDSGFTMTVNGTNFVSSSVVRFDGSNRATTFVSSTQLTATIPSSDLTGAGTFSITVFNGTPGGGESSAQTFTVNNPAPTTSSISPTSATVGDPGFTITVNGTNFVSSSVVKFSGSNRATTFINLTQLTVTIPATDLTAAGNFNITVFNPAPGGGTSNAQTFTVNNPVPTTTSISPSSKTVGDSGFTMTVNGINFVSSSVVRFDGSNRATTFVSSTQLTATIPSSDLTGAGTFSITVFSPTPGGGVSNSQTFTVSAIPPPPDTTAPAAISDLSLSNPTSSSIDLDWTAPGDDGNTGTATTYDIRYSTSLITDGNFNSATQVSGEPVPQVVGTSQSMTVSELSANTTYYFAMKTSDEVPNTSGLSNAPSATTAVAADTTAPAAITNLTLSNATASSIKLTWTAPGDDGGAGAADSYDIRFSTSPITAGNFSSATQVAGEPIPDIAGTSQNMTVTGLTSDTIYYFAMKTSDEVPNTSDLSNAPSLATLSEIVSPVFIPPSVIGGVAPTKIVFAGRAYPGGRVKFFRRSQVDIRVSNTYILDTETIADRNGKFEKQFQALLQGTYFFAVEANDKDGRNSGILSFTANLIANNELEANNIFMPPTVDFESAVVTRGKDLKILGYASPNSAIEAEIDKILRYQAKAKPDGSYEIFVNTSRFSPKDHFVRVWQANDAGLQSPISPMKTFRITLLSNPKADLNNDGAMTIADWSIFLFRWRAKDANLKIDLDGDGKVDVADLSIFLKAAKEL